MCDVLKELFEEVFEESFKFDTEHRIQIQKMVYIMENLGVHIGDYSFVWAERGPYSLSLDDDARRCALSPREDSLVFSKWAKSCIDIVKELLSEKKSQYDTTRWIECVASLHYLKYVLRCSDNDKGIVRELMVRKPKMDDTGTNEVAMVWANKIENSLWGESAVG